MFDVEFKAIPFRKGACGTNTTEAQIPFYFDRVDGHESFNHALHGLTQMKEEGFVSCSVF